ncbi:MAG: AAA family ATPase, partial [Candidatus Korarchaeum sp.]|nr:AAA family ATPase [Candidatus Korarchaeum sp.]MDW8035717.1 AAA family ATPase [Candidatus Korarchaeum sp.]
LKGEPGIGKTSVARISTGRLSGVVKDLEAIHVNCRTYRTPSSVLQKVASSLIPGIPERGLSYEEMALVLERVMSKEEKPLLIVLDEIDYVRNGDSLIYTMLRLHEGGALRSPTVVAVARWEPPYALDESIRSFLLLKMTLEKYTPEQLRDIVSYRASEALEEGSYDEDVIERVVDLSRHTGNARTALKILYLAAKLSEGRGLSIITPDTVSEAAARVGIVGVSEEAIAPLDVHDKLLLLATGKRLTSTGRSWIRMGDLLEEYKLLCEELGVTPYKYTAVWKKVKELSNIGFLDTKKSGEGMRGQTTLISLGSIPADKLVDKLKEMLREDLSPLPSDF